MSRLTVQQAKGLQVCRICEMPIDPTSTHHGSVNEYRNRRMMDVSLSFEGAPEYAHASCLSISSDYGINPDCSFPDELDRIVDDPLTPPQIAEYAACKSRAMRNRVMGNIERALLWEEVCDRLYKLMPECLRW